MVVLSLLLVVVAQARGLMVLVMGQLLGAALLVWWALAIVLGVGKQFLGLTLMRHICVAWHALRQTQQQQQERVGQHQQRLVLRQRQIWWHYREHWHRCLMDLSCRVGAPVMQQALFCRGALLLGPHSHALS